MSKVWRNMRFRQIHQALVTPNFHCIRYVCLSIRPTCGFFSLLFQMLKVIMTVKLDLRLCHGSEIPCSVSFQDDNIISTVSSVFS